MAWNKRDDDRLRSLVKDGLSDSAVANLMSVEPRTVLRWRQGLNLESRWEPDRAPHGAPSRYNGGCRCAECREGNRLRMQEIRRKREGLEPAEHGASGYRNWGCRCDVCSAAGAEMNHRGHERAKAGLIVHVRGGHSQNCPCKSCRRKSAASQRQRNDVSRKTASRNGYEWTGPELEMADRRELTAAQVATMLGRTINAVQQARVRIDSGDIKTNRLLGKHMHGGRY